MACSDSVKETDLGRDLNWWLHEAQAKKPRSCEAGLSRCLENLGVADGARTQTAGVTRGTKGKKLNEIICVEPPSTPTRPWNDPEFDPKNRIDQSLLAHDNKPVTAQILSLIRGLNQGTIPMKNGFCTTLNC